MTLQFSKYHGLGNDFLLWDGTRQLPAADLTEAQVRFLCDRHQGVGADGILIRENSTVADHKMVLVNADGSPAQISGNGLRCFVLFLRDAGYSLEREITVETGGGIMLARITESGLVESSMPRPTFSGSDKPGTLTLQARDQQFYVHPVNVGNPHGVIFGPERDIPFAERYGPALEKHSAFPEGANIEFVNILSPTSCRLVVWERGAGITLACGSGSTATACAGAALGHFELNTPIAVHQPGGTLHITVKTGFAEIRQSGPAVRVFSGDIVL
jgi:diaminopimelate epimerase